MGKKKKELACDCFHVTKKEMKEIIKNENISFKTFQQQTNVGTKCSSCKKKNKKRHKKYLQKYWSTNKNDEAVT